VCADGTVTGWLHHTDLEPPSGHADDAAPAAAGEAPSATAPVAAVGRGGGRRSIVNPAAKKCSWSGCAAEFVPWRGVALLTPEGPAMFCSDRCARSAAAAR
jgi:hypothetical protein